MERVSKINELKLNQYHLERFILFDEKVDHGDIDLLCNEFGFDKEKLKTGIKLYRNLGLVFKLTQQNPEDNNNWGESVQKVIPVKETFNKLDNIFVSKDHKQALLVTNVRLMRYDLERLNKKINDINLKIAIHNAHFIRKLTLKERIIHLFR